MIRARIYIVYVLILIVSLFLSSPVKAADILELKVIELAKGSKGHGLPVIKVHGTKDGYSKILTDKLTYYFTVKMNYPEKAFGPSEGTLKLEKKSVDIEPTAKSKTYKITIPYKNPRAYSTENIPGNNPIQHCNAWLKGQNKSKKALKEGHTLKVSKAYKATAEATYHLLWKKGVGRFKNPKLLKAPAEINVPVNIKCIGLNAPMPRKRTSTRQKERETKAKHIYEFIKLTLDAKPGDEEMIEGYVCPTKAYLYGKIQAKKSIKGSAVFFGPGYISPITKINIPDDGQSTVRATYPINWSSDGKSQLAVDKTKPTTKKFDITFNISNKKNEVIKSTGKKTFTVTCKKPKK